MFNIIILAIGKVRENYIREGIHEYMKRIKPYARVQVHELKATPFKKDNHMKVKEEEGERIIKFLDKKSFCLRLFYSAIIHRLKK